MKYLNIMLTLCFSFLSAVTIHDIQYTANVGDGTYPSDYEGQTVVFGGIVTGIDFSGGRFFVGSSSGGPWSGIYIYNNDYNPAIGDSVNISGEVYEYNGFTEISPLYSLQIISSDNPLPEPAIVTTWDVSNQEAYESVFVELTDVEVIEGYNDWDEWLVSDGTGNCTVCNDFFDLQSLSIPVLEDYSFEYIIGIVSYFWGNFCFNPRSLNDFQAADDNIIISIKDQIIYSTDICVIPLDIIFIGDDQFIESYQFILEYDPGILEFSQINTANTLSAGGDIIVEEPIEGVVEISFDGDILLSGLETLLDLQFTSISSGDVAFDFSEFAINQIDVEFFSMGVVSIHGGSEVIGDTLTIIQRPILNIPEIVTPGEEFTIECLADAATVNWFAELRYKEHILSLDIEAEIYDNELERWFLKVVTPTPDVYELYDLVVSADGLEYDTTKHAVHLIPELKTDYSFIHITDTHLPTHIFYPDPASLIDTTEVEDLREVIRDINLIHPEFVLLTGDLVNEGEMEDFENRRVYTKAQNLLGEFEVPVYLVTGNHDVGGWDNSPPSQGTARRNWWNFFGWKWLQNPPAAGQGYTQDYSFDYGAIHYIGMEAYINYDDYMFDIYGDLSFTENQMDWLENDLENSSGSEATALFYHYDFSDQLYLQSMGIDMALYGHIHSDAGDINNPPYNLATEGVCDGMRAYRIINVNGSVFDPQATINAGWNGENLAIEFFPVNDGTADSITAVIDNQQNLAFDDARIKFKIPAGTYDYIIENGMLVQVDEGEDINTVYVSFDIPANGDISVSLNAESIVSSQEIEIPKYNLKLRNYPNPFNPSTRISFLLPFGYEKDSELTIFNLKGQRIISFDKFSNNNGIVENQSRYSVLWDGSDSNNIPVQSGIYLCRLKVGSQTAIRKILLIK